MEDSSKPTISESKALGFLSAHVRRLVMSLPDPSMMSIEELDYLRGFIKGRLASMAESGELRWGVTGDVNFTHLGVDFTLHENS